MSEPRRPSDRPGAPGAYYPRARSEHPARPEHPSEMVPPAVGFAEQMQHGYLAQPIEGMAHPSNPPKARGRGFQADDEATIIGQVAEGKDRARRPSNAPVARVDESAPQPGYVTVVATHKDPPEHGRLPFVQDADSPIAASFRVLRQRMREVGSPQTIVITSPGKHEGKTSCAINLAMAFAEHRKGRVLLVEANLREPSLAAALGFVTPSCFARQMAAHRANPLAPWEMVAAFFPNLHVLAVDPAANGQWLINGPAFKTAMDQLRSSGYEQIVVDCPAALGSADVNVIEDSADAVLLTAITGKTTGENLRKAARQLRPANIIGVVLLDG